MSGLSKPWVDPNEPVKKEIIVDEVIKQEDYWDEEGDDIDPYATDENLDIKAFSMGNMDN